jgi:hypothetical protein
MNKIFFIVGTGRCGTQMLRNVLGVWSDVVILPETHFIVSLYDKYKLNTICVEQFLEVVGNTYGSNGEDWNKTIFATSNRAYCSYKKDFTAYVESENVTGNIKDFVESFFEFLYGRGYVFGDKTPHYGTNLDVITSIWSEAKVIHLMRDGVDCAHSMLGHKGFRTYINGEVKPKNLDRITATNLQSSFSEKKPTLTKALSFWEDVILETDSGFKKLKKENRLEIKYENVVFHPMKEISKIAKFLKLEDDKRSLNKAMTIPRPFPEKHQVKKISDEEYERCYMMIKDTMDKFGYPYTAKINRDLFETFQELYRGRFNYLLTLKKNIKFFIKMFVGKK